MLPAAAVQPNVLTYGPVTPLLAYGMAVLGSAVGLRCAMRTPGAEAREQAGWLALGSVAVGIGIFTMHVVAMIGFSVGGAPIDYDMLTTYGSLLLAVLVSAVALFVVSRRRPAWLAVLGGGVVLGLGAAATHFTGMTAMRIAGAVRYEGRVMAIAAAVVVVVTTVALWCARRIRHMGASVAAAVIMGTGFIAMQYLGMAGMSVRLFTDDGGVGSSSLGVLTPVLIGPVLVLLLITLFVSLDPMMERDGGRKWGTRPGEGAGEKLEWTPFESR
ncbi:NO-binding membrane sensor protein with MHYT domain [Streptomyces sp. Amel2xB2]|uniref:MHYT domain-containing protein n=1 Tax=Streptomyces sp. Amel2xB2 TaxID=1305829 RepID=UPI000DB931A7|nr:MHYT domain-containing protein [Streptomyces sp. Amel2xB2]RAJ65599.1 NO-binding membrane sensor protein with MHYT domain [Streptomyces sp. Amel2xB2]